MKNFEKVVLIKVGDAEEIVNLLHKSTLARKCKQCGEIVTHPIAHTCGEPERKSTPSGYPIGVKISADELHREDVVDLPCVKCGGAMTSGLGAGYKGDWCEQPHCSVCGWKDYNEFSPLLSSTRLKKGIEERATFEVGGEIVIINMADVESFRRQNPEAYRGYNVNVCLHCGAHVETEDIGKHSC